MGISECKRNRFIKMVGRDKNNDTVSVWGVNAHMASNDESFMLKSQNFFVENMEMKKHK